MSRFARIRRRPDHWSSPHERARVRAAERMDGPLGLAESAWLDEHLEACAACAAIAAAYEADRTALRALGAASLVPPRDLWARTAAVIERESDARGRSAPAVSRQTRRVPLGALSGIAVIAVVVGLSAVSSGLLTSGLPVDMSSGTASASDEASPVTGAPSPTDGGPTPAPLPTPFAVGAGDVRWIRTGSDGTFAYNAAPVDRVCPVDGQSGCATLEDKAARRLVLQSAPQTIIGSPTDTRAVVVSQDESGAQAVTVVVLPAADEPAPSATPAPTVPPPSPTPDPTPTTEPTGSSSPDPTVQPTDPVKLTPQPTDAPTPEPTPVTLALASDIQVVGPSAAFSGDGTWFAFTARPAEGPGGPDVYVWHVGDEAAQRVTADGRSTFASWAGDDIVISRIGETDTSTAPVTPSSVALDPATGEEVAAGGSWRPAVDPSGTRAVAWMGTVTVDAAGNWVPAEGRLVLRAWPIPAPASPDAIAEQVVAEAPLAGFDVRWDETGAWFAAWISDPLDPALGRLSLFRVDPATGLLDQPAGAPIDVPSLAGFSIGEGRLAWATPPGQDGEGSRVQIVAWTDGGVGTTETAPGETLIIVR